MREYALYASPSFKRQYKKLRKQRPELGKILHRKLVLLRKDPFHHELNSQKKQSLGFYTFDLPKRGDLRVAWDFESSTRDAIVLLAIGGHSGSGNIYRS